MRASRRAACAAALLALVLLPTGCEKATGQTPEQVWGKFMDALSTQNPIALPGLATEAFAKRVMRAGPADFANLISLNATAKVRDVKVAARDARSVRLEVVYKSSPDDPAGDKYVFVLEKAGKNWRVAAIEGEVGMVVPGINQ